MNDGTKDVYADEEHRAGGYFTVFGAEFGVEFRAFLLGCCFQQFVNELRGKILQRGVKINESHFRTFYLHRGRDFRGCDPREYGYRRPFL